ncbi:unnamed protein product [Symbiodinium sp. CCMP2592]|nr:unnamed protein product [Symbiodinium sp. CCMP2592]
MDFSVFDLGQWDKVSRLMSRGEIEEAQKAKESLARRAIRLARAYRPQKLADGPNEEKALAEELAGEALQLLPRRRRFMESSGGERPDNRLLWGQTNVNKLQWCGPLLLWYVSVEHTSVAVEQNIGRTRSLLEKHCGPLLDNGTTIDQLLSIVLDGPTELDQVCKRDAEHMGLTDWTREWASTWLERFGRRFCVYRVRSDKGIKRAPQPGSDRSIVERRNASVKLLVESQPSDPRARAGQTSVLGTRLSKLLVRPRDVNDKLKAFNKETQKKRQQLMVGRGCLQQRRTGQILGPTTKHVVPSKAGQYKVIDGTTTATQWPDKQHAAVVRWKPGQTRDFKSLKGASVVVVDDLTRDVHMARAHEVRPNSALLVLQLGMVAYGLSVVSRREYAAMRLCRPSGHILKHRSAIITTRAELVMTPGFRSDNKEFAKALTTLSKDESSKWTVTNGSTKTGPDQVLLGSWSDALAFLRTVRSFDRERFMKNPFIGQAAPDATPVLRTRLKAIFDAPAKYDRSSMGLMSKTSKKRKTRLQCAVNAKYDKKTMLDRRLCHMCVMLFMMTGSCRYTLLSLSFQFLSARDFVLVVCLSPAMSGSDNDKENTSAMVPVKQERLDPVKEEAGSDEEDVELVQVKMKKPVSEKRRAQIRQAEKNRQNKVRSRRSAGQIEKLEAEKKELVARLEQADADKKRLSLVSTDYHH